MSTIEDRVKTITLDVLSSVNYSKTTVETLTLDKSFDDDLGADEIFRHELIMSFEKEFGISIPDLDAENLVTVGDAVAYIKEHAGSVPANG